MRTPFHVIIQPKLSSIIIPVLVAMFYWLTAYYLAPNLSQMRMHITPVAAFFNGLVNPHLFWAHFMGFGFTILLAFLLVQLNEFHSYIRERSLLPFFFFIVIIGSCVNMHEFDFSLLGVLFFLFALNQLFQMYQNSMAVQHAFNIGLYLSIGTLFSFSLSLFIPFFLIGIVRVKAISIKTFFANILGVITPVFIYAGFIYLYSDFLSWKDFFNAIRPGFSFEGYDFISFLFFAVLGFLALISIINFMGKSLNESIKGARLLGVFSFGIIYTVIIYFSGFHLPELYFLAVLFASVLLAHYFTLHINLFIKILFGVFVGISLVYFLSTVFFSF